ncbi:MAG: 2-phospho-L-lactate transferase [Woeseiaceae bacterium]
MKIVALSGGVGGAKLGLGLAQLYPDLELTIIANTGDDFEHLGLCISPDIDTVTYTLAGIANPETGWGQADETWSFMESLENLGGETWFRLGDKDLALNILRTERLAGGESLSEITASIAHQLGIGPEIVPMSDAPIRTRFMTDRGELAFQDYFVRLQCEPVVTGIEFEGADTAQPSPRFGELLNDPSVSAFVLCPSNPLISIDPILAMPSVRAKLAEHAAPVIAVSPVIDGNSIKGPTSKLMAELGIGSSSQDVATHYQDFLDGMVLDNKDARLADAINAAGVRTVCHDVVMNSLDDRCRLATQVVEFAANF